MWRVKSGGFWRGKNLQYIEFSYQNVEVTLCSCVAVLMYWNQVVWN